MHRIGGKVVPREIMDDGLGEASTAWEHEFDAKAEAARFQERLHEHFTSLSKKRTDSKLKVFAFEHDLSEGEFALLRRAVRCLVRQGDKLRKTPLPLAVYIAEIGYRYDGSEFWPLFFEETPGWCDEPHSRASIKNLFKTFAHQYSGVRPTGKWARHFSIICWPIVHAVLPKVFQRQLVEILFNNRDRLTSEVIEDSERLGQLIEGASLDLSDRFRNLAQNHALIGQVATALLTAEDPDLANGVLLQSTVRQIVGDLSQERIAKTWLREAQAATRTIFKGLRAPRTQSTSGGPSDPQVDIIDPKLRIFRSDEGWRIFLELQDLSLLTQRYPEMIADLSQCRGRINGSQQVLPRSALLWPGQLVELSEPIGDRPRLMLIGASERTNGHLSDYCHLRSPPWLFRVQDGQGSAVQGRFVRPASSYVLATPDELSTELSMVSLSAGSISDLNFYEIEVPNEVSDADIEALKAMSIATQTQIRVRPAGLANAGWNGDDVAVWQDKDPVILCLEADLKINHLIVAINDDVQQIAMEKRLMYLDLGPLPVGQHNVQFEAFVSEVKEPVAKESVRVDVRPRPIRLNAGSLREGLVLLTSPVAPTLSELLLDDVEFEVLGPSGVTVTAKIELLSRRKEIPLTEQSESKTLPISADELRRITSKMLHSERVSGYLEECDSVRIAISQRELGTVQVLAERSLTPLRWVVSHEESKPVAQLVDNMDGAIPEVAFRSLSQPDREQRLEYEKGRPLEPPESGLLTATAKDYSISTVVVPGVFHNFADLGAKRSDIKLEQQNFSVHFLRKLVELAKLWRVADKANLQAILAAQSVLRAISVEIAAGIGGEYWERVERKRFKGERVSDVEIIQALAASGRKNSTIDPALQHYFAPDTMNQLNLVANFSSDIRWAEGKSVHSDISLGEFCLRVASQPSSVADLDTEVFQRHASSMINHPITLRLARYIVFRVDDAHASDLKTGAPYEGFSWP